jgi:putative zinc finger/helix-turn-helix YgiT family protein
MAQENIMNFEKRPRGKQILPTHCHFCDKAPELIKRKYEELRPFKGEEFKIPCRDLYCPNCEATIVPDDAIQTQLEALVLAYQERYDLLTAEDIRKKRKALGLSQAQFCKRAKGVAPATLKRVETGGSVQDPSTDRLIRMALIELEMEKHQQELWQVIHKSFTSVEDIAVNFVDFHGIVDLDPVEWGGTLKHVARNKVFVSAPIIRSELPYANKCYTGSRANFDASEEDMNSPKVMFA